MATKLAGGSSAMSLIWQQHEFQTYRRFYQPLISSSQTVHTGLGEAGRCTCMAIRHSREPLPMALAATFRLLYSSDASLQR